MAVSILFADEDENPRRRNLVDFMSGPIKIKIIKSDNHCVVNPKAQF